MMLKVMAIVRTLFLVFLVGYTLRARPLWDTLSKTFDEQYARCAANLDGMTRAAWIAIAWVALETLAGWWSARGGGRKALAPERVAPPSSGPHAPTR